MRPIDAIALHVLANAPGTPMLPIDARLLGDELDAAGVESIVDTPSPTAAELASILQTTETT